MSGPAGELMRARGLAVSPVGVATAYAPWLDALVLERRDVAYVAELHGLGLAVAPADTLMTDRAREVALARVVLSS